MDRALFVNRETIHKRQLLMADGTTHDIWLREIPSSDLRKLQGNIGDPVEYDRTVSRVIAASLCDPDGKPTLTQEEADNLLHGVRMCLATCIAEVNAVGSTVGKVSPPAANSGSGTS